MNENEALAHRVRVALAELNAAIYEANQKGLTVSLSERTDWADQRPPICVSVNDLVARIQHTVTVDF